MTRGSKLRIAVVGPTYPFRGGISHYTTLLCEALRRRHEVRFFSLCRQYPELLFPGKTQIDHSQSALRVDNEPTLDSINPLSWIGTARLIRRFEADLLLFSWWHPFFAPAFGSVARLARWFGGVPSCYLCHNAIPHERSIVDGMLLRYAFSSGNLFIAHSRQDQQDLARLRPAATVLHNPHPTYVIFSGGENVEGDARAKLGLSGKRVLLFFGFIRKYKGLDYLLDAMEQLPAEDGYHLLVVGEFYEDRSHYAAKLQRLEARSQLTLIDRYVPNEEIPTYFSACDLAIVPYLTATQSGVIQMAYGFLKPVVATAVGGLPEVVSDGETGYLIPPGEARAIAKAVEHYFGSADRERMRRRIVVENEKYTWERMVETVEAAHERLAH